MFGQSISRDVGAFQPIYGRRTTTRLHSVTATATTTVKTSWLAPFCQAWPQKASLFVQFPARFSQEAQILNITLYTRQKEIVQGELEHVR